MLYNGYWGEKVIFHVENNLRKIMVTILHLQILLVESLRAVSQVPCYSTYSCYSFQLIVLKHLYFSLCNFGGTFNMEFTYTGKVSRAIGIIYTISSFCLNNSSLRTLYYSPVCPYLFYCVGIWASTYPSSLLQKRVVRIMSRSAFDDHTDPSFKSIGILNLESTVYLQTSSAKIYVSLQIRLTS